MKKKVLIVLVLMPALLLILSRSYADGRFRDWLKRQIKRRQQIKVYYPDNNRDYDFSIEHDGLIRKYKVYLPRSYKKRKSAPVVIYLHGGGGDMRAAYMDGLDKMSDKYGFILAVPEGTGEVKLGHMRARWNGGKWQSGECCGDADDVGFIAKMIDELEANFNVDEKRIYATGISNGGLMTNRLACELSDKIAAIATVAPAAIVSDCNPGRSVPVMDIHGTADPANPPDGSKPRGIFNPESGTGFAQPYKRMTPYQVVDQWKKINRCSDKRVAGYEKGDAKCIIYNDCSNNSEVELCIVEGMGHTYPSGVQYLPESMIGSVSYDISFDQIWGFLKRHPMSPKEPTERFQIYSTKERIIDEKIDKKDISDDSRRLSLIWHDVFGSDFSDKNLLVVEQAWDVLKVDSNLYTTGWVFSGEGNADLFLRKYTEDGQLVWEKKWDNGATDAGFVITHDDSYLYVGGYTRVKVNNIYRNQALLQKYDFNGNPIWTKTWGDNIGGHDEIDGLFVVGSNLYVSHWNATARFRKVRAVIKKLNKSDGSIIWSKSYGLPDKISTADGHIYADKTGVWIAGRLNGDTAVSGGDAYLTKFDPYGNQLWIKTFGYDKYADALSLTSDGQYIYITGMVKMPGKKLDAILAKFDRDGNEIWKKTIGGNKGEYSRGVAADNNYLYAAYSTRSWGEGKSDTILAKYDKSSGELIDYGYWGGRGADEATASLILDEESVYMVGKTSSFGKTFDAVLIKASKEVLHK